MIFLVTAETPDMTAFEGICHQVTNVTKQKTRLYSCVFIS